jgi:hypothetical protein
MSRIFTKFARFKNENSFFSGLFNKSTFIPSDKPQSTTFQKLETIVHETDTIDTYDLVFNLQMPSITESPLFKYSADRNAVDYYCNNKIHIRLYFKDENIFDTNVSPLCVITPQIYSDTTSRTNDGIYFSTVGDVREKVLEATNQAIIEGSPYVIDLKTNQLKEINGQLEENPNRTGPFKDSKQGIDAINIVEKLKNSTYLKNLVEYTGDKLKAGTPNSPFKVYNNTRYNRDELDKGLISKKQIMNTEEKKRYFDSNYQYYIQYDFNLNDYTVDTDEATGKTNIIKKTAPNPRPGSRALNDTDKSLIMLLSKNQWFSVVFQDINIPFDIKQIPENMVKLEFQIDNITPPDAIGDANLFYRNFFCEYLNVNIKLYNTLPINVHDVMFQYEDMKRAIKMGSKKYFSKIAQLNYLARRVLYYYLKDINDEKDSRYTKFYKQMTIDISTATSKTETIISGSQLTDRTLMTELKNSVAKANKDIKEFSNFFKRDNIKNFRTTFLQALMRGHSLSGLSTLTDEKIEEELKKSNNFKEKSNSGVQGRQMTTKLVTSIGEDGTQTITDIAKRVSGITSGGATVYQTGGAKLFQTEDYNLMIPMDIHTDGNGINDMVVRIHKIHLEQAFDEQAFDGESEEMDDKASVDIKVGDAIRFVYDGNIVHAIVCGFKPGKDLNDDGTDKQMNITDFRETYIAIRKTLESQNLNKTPEAFLSLTNMRGIKFLPFKYNDETYSYAPYNIEERLVANARNESVKKGLNGKFVFSCKDTTIPILPNGYVLPFISRAKEGIQTTLNKLNPFSTKADIGNDNKLPQYSLPSYMTLEKVIVPPNFSEVIKLLKDFRGNNPDEIFDKMIKIMETNGLNESNDCKITSVKVAASNFENRKKYYQEELKNIRDVFTKNYVKDGKIIDREGAIQYIKKLYNQQVKPGVFIDSNGNSMIISTKLVFAFDLIPSNPLLSMNILIRALSQDGVPSILERKRKLSKTILESEQRYMDAANEKLFDNDGGGVQNGGAVDVEKADQIIKDTIDLLYKQKFIDQAKKELYVSKLESAEITYDPNEKDTTSRPSITSTSMVKSGIGSKTGPGAGFGANFLSTLFKGSSGTSSSLGMGNDSCGNNTNIVCNGEDLVVTVTLKLNELISSCMNPDMIQHWGGTHGQTESISPATSAAAAIQADDSPVSAATSAASLALSSNVSSDVPPAVSAAPADAVRQTTESISDAASAADSTSLNATSAASASAADPQAAPENTESISATSSTSAAVPKDATSAASPAASPAASADVTKDAADVGIIELLNDTITLSQNVETYVKNRGDIDNQIKAAITKTIDDIRKGKNDDDIITKLKSIADNTSLDKDSEATKIFTHAYGDSIKSAMPAMIDTIRGLLEGMAKEHIDNQDAIISFDTNMKKIVEYSKSDPPIDESIKSLTELYQNPDTKQLIKDTKEPPNINSVLDEKKLKDYIFSKIIDYFESITNVPENKDYIKVFNLLTGIEDVKRPDMVAGNNNKTKNNKKSNKNKTKKRKRKNSSNRKFKFAKVKKI